MSDMHVVAPVTVGDQFQLGWSWVEVYEIGGNSVLVGQIRNRPYKSDTAPPAGWMPLAQVAAFDRISAIKAVAHPINRHEVTVTTGPTGYWHCSCGAGGNGARIDGGPNDPMGAGGDHVEQQNPLCRLFISAMRERGGASTVTECPAPFGGDHHWAHHSSGIYCTGCGKKRDAS